MELFSGNSYLGFGIFKAKMTGNILDVITESGIIQSINCKFFMIGENIPMEVNCKSDGIYLVKYLDL